MLIQKYKLKNIFIGIWKIDEDLDTLTTLVSPKNGEMVTNLVTNSQKIKEKLAVRVLLKEMLKEEVFLKYNEFGRPLLINKPINVSISHTFGYAAVALFKDQRVGIDIEHISGKVVRVESKFINDKEFIEPDDKVKHLLTHWSIKESVYKAMSLENVNLKNDITVQKFNPSDRGEVEVYCRSDLFTVDYQLSDSYVLAVASSPK